ncbi:hypothetical protein D3C76_333160 [compost metagenome]
MNAEHQSLILQHRMVKLANAALHVREVRLQLNSDEDELVLSDYSEHYGPDGLQWVERTHRVAVAKMLDWLLTHAAAHVETHGVETAEHPAQTPSAVDLG